MAEIIPLRGVRNRQQCNHAPPAQGNHRAVQVVEELNNVLELNNKELAAIVDQPGIRDLPVAVISISGKLRQGKSLMMDLFLRYLQLKGRPDWLSDEHGPVDGFQWKGGSDPQTKGISIWSELFVVKSPGREKGVAVMLMDTEGLFDEKQEVQDSAAVFALSTMVSSVQIYNVRSRLAGDDLQHLHMFSEYGNLAQQQVQQGASIFQSLQILIRDWVNKDDGFGKEGGQKVLGQLFNITGDMKPEVRDMRLGISKNFATKSCFLMPEPSEEVRDGSFGGVPSEMGEHFISYVKQFVPSMLAPTNLVIHKRLGQQTKVKDLEHLFSALVDIFKSGQLPTPLATHTANAKYLMESNLLDVLRDFKKSMDNSLGNQALKEDAMNKLANTLREKAIKEFNGRPKFGTDEMLEKYCQKLKDDIDDHIEQAKLMNAERLQLENELREETRRRRAAEKCCCCCPRPW